MASSARTRRNRTPPPAPPGRRPRPTERIGGSRHHYWSGPGQVGGAINSSAPVPAGSRREQNTTGHRDHCFRMRRTGGPSPHRHHRLAASGSTRHRPPTAALTTHPDSARPPITRKNEKTPEEAGPGPSSQPDGDRAIPIHTNGSATTRRPGWPPTRQARHAGSHTPPAHCERRPIGSNSHPSRPEKSLLIYKECARVPKRTGSRK